MLLGPRMVLVYFILNNSLRVVLGCFTALVPLEAADFSLIKKTTNLNKEVIHTRQQSLILILDKFRRMHVDQIPNPFVSISYSEEKQG